MKKDERLREGHKCAVAMLIATFLLAVIKLFVGWLSNSIAVTADGVHSMTDVIVLFIALIGITLARKEPTKKFPYGYYKAESIAALFISFSIVIISFSFFYEGYLRLFQYHTLNHKIVAISITLFSVIASYAMARYLMKVGEKTGIHSLIATSNERKMDAISSSAVLIAIVLNSYGIKYGEGIVTIGIAALILRTGIVSVKDAIASLMDFSPSDVEERVKRIIESSRAIGYKDLKLRKAGPFIFGEVKLLVDGKLNVEKAHEIADEVERKVKKIEGMDDFITHVEPFEENYAKIAIPIENKQDKKIANKFGRAKYFLIVEIENGEVKNEKLIENKWRNKKVRAGLAAARLLEGEVDAVITKDMGEIAYYALREKNIRIFKGDGEIKDLIRNYIDGKLNLFEKPKKVE